MAVLIPCARFIMDEENGCRIEDQRQITESPQATSLVNQCHASVLICLNYTQFIYMVWHMMLYNFLMVGTIFYHAKVNTVPCIFTAALSLRLQIACMRLKS